MRALGTCSVEAAPRGAEQGCARARGRTQGWSGAHLAEGRRDEPDKKRERGEGRRLGEGGGLQQLEQPCLLPLPQAGTSFGP